MFFQELCFHFSAKWTFPSIFYKTDLSSTYFLSFLVMASAAAAASRDQFLCSICLDVLVQPVSTLCGQNFCMNSITTYWVSATHCHCPTCMERFEKRLDLKVNTFILEVVTPFQLQHLSENYARPLAVKTAAVGGNQSVHCDVCTGNTRKTFMFCVQCGKSYYCLLPEISRDRWHFEGP